MSLQKLFRISAIPMLVFLFAPSLFSNNGVKDPTKVVDAGIEQQLEALQLKADLIIKELEVLKSAKRLAVTSQEKKAIREKAKELRGELNATYAEGKKVGGGVYIGSTLLVVIILILLLV